MSQTNTTLTFDYFLSDVQKNNSNRLRTDEYSAELLQMNPTPTEVLTLLEEYNNNSELYSGNYYQFLRQKINDPDLFLSILNQCDCCDRHKKNRPNTINKLYSTPVHFHESSDCECSCSCRHHSRFIYRAFREDNSPQDRISFQ